MGLDNISGEEEMGYCFCKNSGARAIWNGRFSAWQSQTSM